MNCDHIDDDETTCDVLRDIASDIDSANCTTNGNYTDCDTVRCMSTSRLAITSYNVTVLPCNKPPGIRVTLVVNGNSELDGRIFTESEDVDISGGFATIKVTLVQLEDEHSIGVAVWYGNYYASFEHAWSIIRHVMVHSYLHKLHSSG